MELISNYLLGHMVQIHRFLRFSFYFSFQEYSLFNPMIYSKDQWHLPLQLKNHKFFSTSGVRVLYPPAIYIIHCISWTIEVVSCSILRRNKEKQKKLRSVFDLGQSSLVSSVFDLLTLQLTKWTHFSWFDWFSSKLRKWDGVARS